MKKEERAMKTAKSKKREIRKVEKTINPREAKRRRVHFAYIYVSLLMALSKLKRKRKGEPPSG